MSKLRFLISQANTLKQLQRIRFKPTQGQQSPLENLAAAQTINPINIPLFNSDIERYQYYSGFRIYKNQTWLDLCNLIVMTTCCTNGLFVDNCHHLYNITRKVLGVRISEFLVANTMGRIFTSGHTLEQMDNSIATWRYPNINILISYSNEAPIELITPEMLDNNALNYVWCVQLCHKSNRDNYGIALKCSSICSMAYLRIANSAQIKIRSAFSPGFGNLSESLNTKQIGEFLKANNVEFSFRELQEFIKLFFNKELSQENQNELEISKFEWLNEMHMFYVDSQEKNSNKILKQLAGINESDLAEIEKLSQRLKLICDEGFKFKQKVLIDAEQTYLQAAIDSFTVQFSNIYNKGEIAIVLNTFQNYLKSSPERIKYEVERCKALGLPFGMKMVRGAYMVEERRLAREYSYEDPILPNIEDTHQSYNGNLEYLMSNWIPGSRVVIASHNESSINWGKQLITKYNINSQKGAVSFAQLLGLGDHLTHSLASEGYAVGKLCHYGPLHYMVPFLIRRAQESKQVLASSSLKRRLAFNEIFQRIKSN